MSKYENNTRITPSISLISKSSFIIYSYFQSSIITQIQRVINHVDSIPKLITISKSKLIITPMEKHIIVSNKAKECPV